MIKKMHKNVFSAFMAGTLFALWAMAGNPAFAQSKFSEEELAYMPAVKLLELFKKGEVAPSEVLEAQIKRVKKYNGEYNESRRDLVNELDTFNAGKVNAITFDKFAEAREQARKRTNATRTALRAGLKASPSASRTRMKSRDGASTRLPFP